MADERAKEIIHMFEVAEKNDTNFMNLYQETSNYVYPLENAILSKRTPGESKMAEVLDTTAIEAADDMVNGLSSVLIPPGQTFFAYGVEGAGFEAEERDETYLQFLTDRAHEEMFSSNFMMVHDEFLKSWVVFGDSGISAEPGEPGEIVFADYLPGHYHYFENSKGVPDTFIEMLTFTARQAYQEFGEDAGPCVLKDLEQEATKNNNHDFIHVIRRREDRNIDMIDVMNMAWEDIYVSKKDMMVVKEGGQPEFKVHISRWEKARRECRGRGLGVKALPRVRSLNSMYRDLVECANRHNNPPLLVSGMLDDDYDNSPGALNYSSDINTAIKPVGVEGNFPITRDIYDMEREAIRDMFMGSTFNQFMNLKGDRRTTLEISEKAKEGLRRVSKPIGRLIYEELSPLLMRVALIMIREGMVPRPPLSLQGRRMKVSFLSPLILELHKHQARGFMEWFSLTSQAEAFYPGAMDNIEVDKGIRDVADALGVKSTHKRPQEDVDAMRQARAAQMQQRQMAESTQVASDAYAKTTKSPEEGSPAAVAMGNE